MATTRLGVLKGAMMEWTWPPAVTLAKKAVLRTFSCVEEGMLVVVDEPGSEKHRFGARDAVGETGTAKSVPSVEIVVKRDTFWARLFLFADIGFAEAYMLGDFECADLTSFFRVCFYFTLGLYVMTISLT